MAILNIQKHNCSLYFGLDNEGNKIVDNGWPGESGNRLDFIARDVNMLYISMEAATETGFVSYFYVEFEHNYIKLDNDNYDKLLSFYNDRLEVVNHARRDI